MSFTEHLKGARALLEKTRPEPDAVEKQRSHLRIIRGFVIVEFTLALLASILLPLALVAMGAAAYEQLTTVWYFVIAPAMGSGAALLLYHARSTGRPWSSTLGELLFWLTFPVGATIFLFFAGAQLPAA